MNSEKPILAISVAATLLGLHPRTLMLYESAGFIIPHRTATQRRMFSIQDLEHLQFIKYLTHENGVNLRGVKIILEALSLAEKEKVDLKKLLFPSFKPKHLI